MVIFLHFFDRKCISHARDGILHDLFLNALKQDRSTTFIHIILWDVACMGM